MHKYDVFVPMSASPVSDSGAAPGTGDKQPKQPTEKGALYYEYYQLLHIFITHLRRVHWENPIGEVKGVAVKAADPLAPKGTDLYYYHSRTAYYNSFFFEFWDECFAPTFSLVCPFYQYKSVQNVEKLLDAKFERCAVPFQK